MTLPHIENVTHDIFQINTTKICMYKTYFISRQYIQLATGVIWLIKIRYKEPVGIMAPHGPTCRLLYAEVPIYNHNRSTLKGPVILCGCAHASETNNIIATVVVGAKLLNNVDVITS